jgi:hypothetical protein
MRGDTVYCWGVRRTGLAHGAVYAMRYVFSTQHTDSLQLRHFRAGTLAHRPAEPPVPGIDGVQFVGVLFRFSADQPAALVRNDFRLWQRMP